jgi:S-adenosyl methyltransferase
MAMVPAVGRPPGSADQLTGGDALQLRGLCKTTEELRCDRQPAPSGQRTEPPEIDARVPNSARIWEYWLGGRDNHPVDRQAGDQFRAIYPQIVEVARASRAFLTRAVRYLAGEAHVQQFLDLGTGLPTADNTHEVAQDTELMTTLAVTRTIDRLSGTPVTHRELVIPTPPGRSRHRRTRGLPVRVKRRRSSEARDLSLSRHGLGSRPRPMPGCSSRKSRRRKPALELCTFGPLRLRSIELRAHFASARS